MQSHIGHAVATGEEINNIVTKIEDVLQDAPRGHAIISCLSLVLILMNPLLTPQELQTGVKDVSQYICCWLEGTSGTQDEGDKVVMN